MRLTRLALAGAAIASLAAPAASGGERPLPDEERRAIVRTLECLWALRAGGWQCVATQETRVP